MLRQGDAHECSHLNAQPSQHQFCLAQGCKTEDKDGKLPVDWAIDKCTSLESLKHIQALVLGSPAGLDEVSPNRRTLSSWKVSHVLLRTGLG